MDVLRAICGQAEIICRGGKITNEALEAHRASKIAHLADALDGIPLGDAERGALARIATAGLDNGTLLDVAILVVRTRAAGPGV